MEYSRDGGRRWVEAEDLNAEVVMFRLRQTRRDISDDRYHCRFLIRHQMGDGLWWRSPVWNNLQSHDRNDGGGKTHTNHFLRRSTASLA